MSPVTRIAGALALLLAISACTTGPRTSSNSSNDAQASSVSSSASLATDSFPVKVEHALGSTTIEAEPTRVATLGWTDHETAASLGVVPVGAVKTTWGGNAKGSTDWFDAKVTELGGQAPTRYADTDGAPVQEIAKLRPDLILATNSGITEDEYKQLSQIAPVVAYPTGPWATTWQESLDLVGKALGRSKAAAQVKADTLELIKEKSAGYPQLKGKSAAFAWFAANDLSKIGLYVNKDARPVFLSEIGFETPGLVKKLSQEQPGQFSVEVSAERAKEVDADVVMFYTADDLSEEKITSAPLIRDVPAIANGSYVVASDPAKALPLSAPSPLSIPVGLDTFLPPLAEAAGKAA